MEQKTIQINIEDDNGIQSFVVYHVRYKNKTNGNFYSWLTYLDKEDAMNAVDMLDNLPEVSFAFVENMYVFFNR